MIIVQKYLPKIFARSKVLSYLIILSVITGFIAVNSARPRTLVSNYNYQYDPFIYDKTRDGIKLPERDYFSGQSIKVSFRFNVSVNVSIYTKISQSVASIYSGINIQLLDKKFDINETGQLHIIVEVQNIVKGNYNVILSGFAFHHVLQFSTFGFLSLISLIYTIKSEKKKNLSFTVEKLIKNNRHSFYSEFIQSLQLEGSSVNILLLLSNLLIGKFFFGLLRDPIYSIYIINENLSQNFHFYQTFYSLIFPFIVISIFGLIVLNLPKTTEAKKMNSINVLPISRVTKFMGKVVNSILYLTPLYFISYTNIAYFQDSANLYGTPTWIYVIVGIILLLLTITISILYYSIEFIFQSNRISLFLNILIILIIEIFPLRRDTYLETLATRSHTNSITVIQRGISSIPQWMISSQSLDLFYLFGSIISIFLSSILILILIKVFPKRMVL